MNIKILERDLLSPLGEIEDIKVEINIIPCGIKVITLLDNTKPGAETILKTVREKIPHNEFINIKKPAGAQTTDEKLNKAFKADLAILAIGDCGSCTTWQILDAIKLEKKGIPTICVCSDVFASFARELAQSYGAEELRIVEIEHPVAGQSREVIEDKAGHTLEQIKELIKNCD